MGTTTPGQKVEIDDPNNAFLYLNATGNSSTSEIDFTAHNAGGSARNGSISLSGSGNMFFNTAGFSGNNRLSIMQLGNVGIGTGAPNANLDIRANGLNSGTVAIASISGQSSFAALTVDNSGVGDLFTASSSGLTRFVITQSGNVGYRDNVPRETARQLGRFALPIGHG